MLSFAGIAQEQLGLRYENYSGVNSLLINPANNLSSKFKWDINLVEAGVFFDNSYGFIRNSNLIEIARNSDNIQSATEIENPNLVDPDVLLFDFFDNENPKFVSTIVEVMGPSFMVNLPTGHTFGLFTRARAVVGGRNLPGTLNYYTFENALEGEALQIPALKIAGMSWTEIGLNYGMEFFTSTGSWGIGANLRMLNGYEAFYTQHKGDFQITRFPNDSIAVGNLDLGYGFTNSTIEADSYRPERNGGGFGLDLGAIWTFDEVDNDYKFKLGVSLLDLGRISFNRNAEQHELQVNGEEGFDTDDFDAVTEADEGIELLSELLLGDSSLSYVPGGFGVWLPTALSIQADYQVVPMVYVNASLVQSIPLPGPAIARNDLLALSPRIEHRWFGLSLPLVLYNWQDFRVGTAVRLGFLTLGSDNIGSILGNSNFTGTDFYLALKVNPFQIKLGGGGKGTGGGGKNVKCYEF